MMKRRVNRNRRDFFSKVKKIPQNEKNGNQEAFGIESDNMGATFEWKSAPIPARKKLSHNGPQWLKN